MVSSKKIGPAKVLHKGFKKTGKIEKKQKTKRKPAETEIELLKPEKKKEAKGIKESIQDTKITVLPKKSKYVMPSKYIKESVVNSCLEALQQLAVQYKKKNALLEDETQIFAEIHCMKIQNTRGNIKFVFPHSTVASTGEICLITTDLKKGRKVDHEPTVDHWEEVLRKAGVTEVKTILPLRQLKVEYDQFELKRRLLTQHDYIMIDTRVLNHASHLLGKMFFKKHNMLIPVRINDAKIKESINTGIRTAMLRVNEGETSTILIGHTGMSKEHLKENVLSLVEQIKTKFPGGEANIRSLALKLPLSVKLPLYITLRPSSTVKPPKLGQKRPKNFRVLEDELSTIPGSKVRVAPDGTVKLIKEVDVDKSDMEDEDEQENKGKAESENEPDSE